jgi:hypothetical protein
MIFVIIFILQFPLLFIATKVYKYADGIKKLDGEDIKFLAWGVMPILGFGFSVVIILLIPIYLLSQKGLAQKIADLINGDNK